jgi:prepilin-type N-terminal cleavage/methylation domain-containing protein
MIVSKSNKGFSLIEVMVAVTFMGLVMTAVFVLQGNSIRSINKWARHFDRIMAGMLFMTQTGIEKSKDATNLVDKKLAKPATNMRYQMMEIPETSSLKDLKDVYIERVTLTWQEGKKKKQDTILMVRHRPEIKKE